MKIELTEKQKEWLFKGEELELKGKMKTLQDEYRLLLSELNKYTPSYNQERCEVISGSMTKVTLNSYENINSTLRKIEELIIRIKTIDDKIKIMNENYEVI